MKKKYLFFDLDGTITDPKEGITKSVRYSLNSFGIDAPLDDLTKFIGPPLKESFMTYYNFDEADAIKAVKKYREYFSEQGIFENTAYLGMEKLLKHQKNLGKTLIVATSKPTVFAEKVLKHFNLFDYFTFISGSELDGTRSKKGEVIQYAIDKLMLNCTIDSIMIGDREHDIIGAKTLGMDSIGVLYGYGSFNELQTAGANYIAETVDDLLKLLNTL